MSGRDRALAGAVSGPLGRGVAFVTDLAAAVWSLLCHGGDGGRTR
ncbi:MAG TPA: hypothetical protein VFH44_11340 [Solirubrobacterales bacterium]|nr:hypothetical protein [Solirubrobacterales bacterium]